ncbi:MAG: hypothetical protein RL329_161 [Bacteroidota bacterium]|jgi:hypothetical protein
MEVVEAKKYHRITFGGFETLQTLLSIIYS